MASSPSKNELCLFCSMSESMSEDVDWVQCGKCKHWAHFSCAGVDQGIVNSHWLCPQCVPSSVQQLRVPDAADKRRSKKSGKKSDGGSDQGVGSDVDPVEKQLEEEQLAKEKAFAKQMAARKKLLARQKEWKEEQLKQEREMRELELQVQREMEEQQLQHEQEMLDAQLAAERDFVKKRDAIRKQFANSVNRVNALKDQEGAVGGASADIPKQRVHEWLDEQTEVGKLSSAVDFRGAYPKGDPLRAESKKVEKPKPMKKVRELIESESESSEEDESSDSSEDRVRSSNKAGDGPGRSVGRSSKCSEVSGRSERVVGRITREQLAARKAVSQHLPKFRGEAEVWPLFISSFEHTTAACGFTNLENLKRLQDCLQGDALEAVRSRLVLPDSVPDVIRDLRSLFGKPEKLLKTLLTKVRSAPAPRADRLETFINFGITVKQLCDHLEAARLTDHLSNPMLVQELVDKLPPSYKLDWVRCKRGRVDSPLRMFTNFATDIVSDVSEVAEFTTLSMNDRVRPGKENNRKKEFVHVHESEPKRSEANRSDVASRPCWICRRTDHLIRNCEEFRRMNIAERLREVERQKLCGVCLNKHNGNRCPSKIRCVMRNCQGAHHPLLHRVEESVQLQHRRSSATLVDDVVAKRLKAEGTLEPLIVTWTGNINRFENESRSVEMMMSAKGSREKFPLFNTRTVSELQLPKQKVRYAEVVQRYKHLAGVPTKDFPYGVPTILIGLDNLHLFALLESRVGKPNEPIAVRSKMGWTIYGSEKRKPTVQTYLNLHSVAPVSNQELHDLMRHQYVLDEIACSSFAVPEPAEEKWAREILETTTKRIGDRFETGLLWRQDERRFPDSYPMAVRRMKALDRKLERSPALKENVCRQIEEYQMKGYAHKATDAELTETPQAAVWYLPLNVVVNPRKPGKVRLVWDAAASVNGVSLNSELLKGPDMLVPLPRVICNFRERPVAFGGDIQEMYHQIRIRTEDKQAQRFIFRGNSDDAPQVYVMDVATFGSTCSPSSAQFVKNLNAEQFSDQYPKATVAIVKRHYVDDYYDSVDTVEEAVQRANDVKYIHSRGGFHIRNWVSNSGVFLENLGERSSESSVHFSLDKSTEYERVLGIVWDTVEDVFCFASASKSEYAEVLSGDKRPTKRIVLSIVMAQFDPVGYLAPVTILGKMLIQDLWRTGCQLDEVVDEASFGKWKRWTDILADVRAFKLPRSYFGSARSEEVQDVQLHIFADASETAYGCVAYFRAVARGEVMCALVMSRAKVAPLKQLSIPRLELLAAVLGARMSQTVYENHNFHITKVVFWIDAEVVLSWIRSDQRRYKQFVGFRIGEILSLTRMADWRWVPTKLNVADQLTKWGKNPEIDPNSSWVRGQQFLYESEEEWPKKSLPPANTMEELRVHLLLHDVKVPAVLVDVNRFSKWTVLVRTMACVIRFVSNCRRKRERLPIETLRATRSQLKVLIPNAGASVRLPLKQDEYEKAERCLLRIAQSESFVDELKVLSRNKIRPASQWMTIEKSSPLYKLTPLVDEHGLIRMEGRVERAEFLPFDLRFPVILPDDDRITRLIVQHYHERSGHGYRQAVKNELRQLYYIPHVDAVVRKVSASCMWCKVHRCRPEAPRMAPLPVQRVTPNLRAFSYVGVDYLGPYDVTVGRRTEKRWIALFTCMVTRAVHLEVAHGLTTQSCLMAIHRFIGRRGWPIEFFSDNGTNLRGASKEVVEAAQGIRDDCADLLTNARTKWTFNPPAAPHMGGVWERLVRSVKEALRALDDGRRLTNEILQTAIVEAEDIINSRPLTYVSQQSDEAEALTPNHFLRGASPNQPCVALPPPHPALALRDAFQRSQQLASVMWERWIKEYVPLLNQRTKWFGEARPLRAGDLVYVVESANRKCWVRGVIEEAIKSGDGRVRQAWVRTSTGRYKRATVKLARMEIEDGNPEPDVASGTELRAGECSGSPAAPMRRGGAKQQVVAYTEKSQDKHESRHIQLVREYGFHPRSKVQVEDGAVLPRKFEPFPDDMYGRPLEEIDNFIYEETFCVVSKRFRKNYIHRFTGTKSLFCFTPWSPTRRACVYLATNQFFDYFVMATILFNCIFLAMSETIEEAEYIFLAIYTCEMIIKMIAKGFILNKYTYLRNPWNWLDFVVITSGYATIALDVGNLAGLRTFRVLRALKTVSIMPGLKTIINALLHSFKQLAEVMTLTIFCLMVFALFALQVYMGELRNKCVKNPPEGWNVTHEEWRMWVNDTENWLIDDEDMPLLCGNLTGARHCPPEYTCLCVGENPNHGYTNFDNFMWSMLTTFQLITLDYWENVYNMVLATCGPMSVSFFTVVVFFGSFYLINLMLAVVALSYEEEAEITQEERRKDLIDHRDDSTFSFDPASLNVKQLSKQQRKKLDARKGVLLASYSRKKTRRRKKGKEGGDNGNNVTKSRSVTPSPSPSPRHSIVRPQALALQRTKGMLTSAPPAMPPTQHQQQNPNTLHPLGLHYRGQLLPSSRQASSNASEGGVNRESSLDDSGVVDDHEEQDVVTGTELVHSSLVEQREVTPVTLALSPREVRIIKCNGNLAKVKKHNVYALHPEYLSQIVVLDDLPDRNCDRCVQCCISYEKWLQFQNCLYKIVKDPLFELGITLCIVLNTLFLALEHHGMNENVRDALEYGNRVFTAVFSFECILKVMALSKDFFLCGWNIFDLIIVSASLLDLIFELMEGLTVLRGLRLLRVLKLAQSWTTMKVLLSIIISTIGALGNLTFVLVIVIYIFAVIGMQLFSKDYTPDKFAPDPVPRWNFNDFFHSFMMIFRILCGEWIEPLWDCMRAEEEEGASSCFAIFLPALVMGNFMVLNLFLALLLNSFNSEELKSKKESFEQEVGEDSKLARSFERIRSIVRKKRNASKEKNENDTNTRLEKLVNEIVIKQREEKKKYTAALVASKDQTIVLPPTEFRPIQGGPIYSPSYQESLTQRVPPEQLCYDIPLKDRPLRTISGSQETVSQMDDRQLPDDGQPQMTEVERKILQQMSSGFGTQQSKDEPTVTESLEMRSLNPINSSEIDPNEQSIHISDSQPYDEAYLQYQKSLLNRSPSYRKSLDRTSSRTSSAHSLATSLAKCHSPLVQEVLNAGSHYLRNSNISLIQTPTPVPRREDNHFLVADRKSSLDKSITASPPQPISQQRSPSTSSSMRKAVLAANRFSDQSLNTLSIDHDELINQMNLKDELLNCEQKELFQFLNDEVDNSNNYFSDTVGYGSAVVDADTESLLLSSKKDDLIYSPDRKVSNGSLKSNLSSISNSIFQALENRRGGSISGSMDKPRPTIAVDNGSLRSRRNSDDKEPLVKASEFDDIIHSFDTELKSLKSLSLGRSHSQADAPMSPERERRNSNSCPTMPAVEEVVRLRRPKSSIACNYRSSSADNNNTNGNKTSDNDNNNSNTCNNNPRISTGNDSNSSNTDSNTQRSETSKRRSLEKQRNITDEEFNMGVEIKKLCDQLQAPFAAPTVVQEQPKSSSANGLSTLTPFTGLSAGGGNNMSSIPIVFRRKNDFHSSFDRIKRLSLIERVEECNEDEKAIAQPPKASSEILPRKQLSKDCLETLSLKSSYSVENGDKPLDDSSKKIGISLEEFQRNIAQESSSEPPAIRQPPKKTVTYSETSRQNSSQQATPKRTPFKTYESDAPLNLAGKPWHCLVSYVDDITVGGRRNSQGVYDDPMAFPSFGRRKAPKIPQDCFPQKCYEKCKCWDACLKTDAGQRWYRFRQNILQYVDTPAFEWFVLVLIFASSITLCFEDIHLDKNKQLKRILYWTNFVFCLIFVIEMLLKWIALGFTKYFSSFWTILDFIIVFVSVFSLLIEENENLKVLRSLRTLRALRPLRAISRWQGMRIVVNALMYAIPSIFNVLLVCLVFWLIFSIMGVQFFGGKFFKCVDEDGELLPIHIVNDKWQCFAQNYTWINSKITFDHVGMGYLALFQVATFEGWMEVMADAVDARGVDLQPQREANLYAYFYFVIFIVCGSFFTLNLFIGVIIDNFNMLKKKYEGGVLEMFLTESQKHYYTAMKKLGRKKPQKVIKRPINQILAMFYDLSNSRRFEIAIFVLIFLNMLTMGIEHYNQPHAVFFILEVSNAFFTTVFGLEAIVKIIGLRYHYFTVPWNVFDFLLVLASIFGILMEDIMIDLPISPTLLRVVRVFRIGRILRLIKAAKGIRKLLFALVVSLPALFNIGALLALITFIYAIIGMSLFGHVRQQGALDDMVNFETFGRSMQLLFRLMTSAGWNDVLESLMIQPPDCELAQDTQGNGDCGHPLLAITYFTSFIIISYMIVINMYIAIILENFNQAHQEEEVGIVEDDLEMFYIRWSKYDPHAGQFIHFNQLSDFIASLDPPLGIPKPNTVALVSFNLPISKGNKIHCLDILHALVKHVLGHVEETENFKQLQDQMDQKFKKQFPTRKELEIVSSTRIWKRQEKAAKTIQAAWKDYLRRKRERERSPMSLEDDNTQTSSPGGWQSKLSALNFLHLQVHRRGTATSSRASSRKSSRASDASDLSELAGPWLNLPLMLVSGTSDMVKEVKQQHANGLELKDAPEAKGGRRRSFYNFPFFLRHQDAVEDPANSPQLQKRPLKSSETDLSLTASLDKAVPPVAPTTPVMKHKRATSFVKKKPPLERGFSAQSALRLNRNAAVLDDNLSASSADVSILVTEPSPDVPTGPNMAKVPGEATLVHVLVHRESEEYQSDVDDKGGSTDGPRPVVTICVESPQESPDSPQDRPGSQPPQHPPPPLPPDTVIDMVDPEPIDVNLPRDTSNIFYDYEEPKEDAKPPEIPPRAHQHPLQDLDRIEYDAIQQMSSSTSSATSASSSSSAAAADVVDDQCQCPPSSEDTLQRSS